MLDISATLRAGNGAVRSSAVLPPTTTDQPLWTAVAELDGAPPQPDGFSLHLVGACGIDRTDTMVRAAGEAVERCALLPPSAATGIRATAADLPGKPIQFTAAGLSSTAAQQMTLGWYPARQLVDDAEVLVPAPLIDYPLPGRARAHFDPSPSGAAAGRGLDAATRAALREIVERDAVMVAWARQERLTRIDPGCVAGSRARDLTRLLSRCEELGLEIVVAEIPSVVPSWRTAICVLRDRAAAGGALVSAGAKTAADGAAAVLGAAQEALQIRGLLISLRRHHDGPCPGPAVVTGDVDRARRLASAHGAEELWEWACGFIPRPTAVALAACEPSFRAVVDALVADGANPVMVDLTGRLPAGLQALGWAAVKVVAPGYQPLRMDERHTFGWLSHRIGASPTRRPHPLV